MTTRLRSLLPELPRITGRAYFRGLWGNAVDSLSGRQRDPLVPPARFDTNGNGDYVTVGNAWARRFYDLGLAADHDAIEIGCGTGRIARGLVGTLRGNYIYRLRRHALGSAVGGASVSPAR